MGLLVHCGAERTTWEELEKVPTPTPTKTHMPVPHHEFVNRIRTALPHYGLQVVQEEHALSNDQQSYFGVLRVEDADNPAEKDGFSRVVGVRNSHNKKLAAGLVSGSSVLVCDNLAFSGEVRVSHKHTSQIFDALDDLIDKAVGRLKPLLVAERHRVEAYRNYMLGCGREAEVDVFFMSLMRKKALTPSNIGKAWDNWAEPKHEEFQERNMWSLFNAVTEAHKGVGMRTLFTRSKHLHAVCDEIVGFQPLDIETIIIPESTDNLVTQ
jgi:hypothetical protein